MGGTNFQQYTASSTIVASSAGGHSCFGNATTGVTASGGVGVILFLILTTLEIKVKIKLSTIR